MKPASRTAVLVLSAAFCAAAAFGLANSLVSPPPPIPVREPIEPPHPAPPGAPQQGTPRPAPAAASTAPDTATAASPFVRLAANRQIYHDGSYTGPLEDAFYGFLSVRVDIQAGRIVDIQVLRYPSDNPTSRYINALALPYLKSEVIGAQTVYVDMISGATLTSNAFLRSTYMALRRARG